MRDCRNAQPRTTGRRRPLEALTDEERAHLLPLPCKRYESVVWEQATVHGDCHVHFDERLYSVPWRLINKKCGCEPPRAWSRSMQTRSRLSAAVRGCFGRAVLASASDYWGEPPKIHKV